MRKFPTFIILVIVFVLAACADKNETILFPDPLDIPPEGKFTVFYLYDSEKELEYDVYKEIVNHPKVTRIPNLNFKTFNQIYRKQIKATPAIIFINSKGEVIEFYQVELAEEYLEKL